MAGSTLFYLPPDGRAVAYEIASTFPRRGKVARNARRSGAADGPAGMFQQTRCPSSTSPFRPSGTFPLRGKVKQESKPPYAIALPSGEGRFASKDSLKCGL